MIRPEFYEIYETFEHFSTRAAIKLFENSAEEWYRVTTINWTYATENGKQTSKKVHKNVYRWTLEELIEFIRDTEEVAEDIISIEKCKT
jgi:hypothetical protein